MPSNKPTSLLMSLAHVPSHTWTQEWVVDCRPVGSGAAALKYLAPYVFRVAISNNRILKLEDDQVTFTYKDGTSGKPKRCTLHAERFIQRFLQHILPTGFVKIRYYGLFSPGNRRLLHRVRSLLVDDETDSPSTSSQDATPEDDTPSHAPTCPKCRQIMSLIQSIPRRKPP